MDYHRQLANLHFSKNLFQSIAIAWEVRPGLLAPPCSLTPAPVVRSSAKSAEAVNAELGKVMVVVKNDPSVATSLKSALIGLNIATMTAEQIASFVAGLDKILGAGAPFANMYFRLTGMAQGNGVSRAALKVIQQIIPPLETAGNGMNTIANSMLKIAKIPAYASRASTYLTRINIALSAYATILSFCDISKFVVAEYDYFIAKESAELATIRYQNINQKYCRTLGVKKIECEIRPKSISPVLEMIEGARCQEIVAQWKQERGSC